MKLLCVVFFVLSAAAAFAQPGLQNCDNLYMRNLTACMATNICFDCLSGAQYQGSSSESNPADKFCSSYVCPVVQKQSCCPQCKDQAEKMQECIVEFAVAEGAESENTTCSCGMRNGGSGGGKPNKEGERMNDDPEENSASEQPGTEAPDLEPQNPDPNNSTNVNETGNDWEDPDEISSDPEAELGPEEPGAPIESSDPCAISAAEYDQCVLDRGAACLSCVSFITDTAFVAVGTDGCRSLNKQIRSASQCCCGPELKKMATCSVKEAGSSCQIGDMDGSNSMEDPTPSIPDDENEPGEQPEEQTCSELAVAYDQCLREETCFSCIDQAAHLSPRSFAAGAASCQAVHAVVCPAEECCCSSELAAFSECSHLEEHGFACDIDCDGFDSATDTGNDDSETPGGVPEDPSFVLPDRCGDAAALYDLCVDTAECSSCQTEEAIARASLLAFGEGRSGDYSCGTITGVMCPAIVCCCGRELREFTECTLEANFKSCSVDCSNEQNELETASAGNNQQNNPASPAPIRWSSTEASICSVVSLVVGLGWLFAW